MVLLAGDAATPESAAALDQLCRQYWQPLYYFVRRRGYNEHDEVNGRHGSHRYEALLTEITDETYSRKGRLPRWGGRLCIPSPTPCITKRSSA